MLTVPPSIHTPTAVALPPSTLGTGTPDRVSTRITPVALAAPLPDVQVTDDPRRQAPPIATAPLEELSVATYPISKNASQLSANNALSTGHSAPFLAQLLGQDNNANNVALAASFVRFAPAPEYNTFAGYSFIKYKPSNAGVPQPRAPLLPASTDTAVETAPLPDTSSPAQNAIPSPPSGDYTVYSDTALRNQSQLAPAELHLMVAG